MNKEWSEKNKKMQALIAKESTFADGIKTLLELRNELFDVISYGARIYPAEAYYQMPCGDGHQNHHATIGWSLWHVFRIEDIVVHTLILQDKQIFENGWKTKTKSTIITTGNELDGKQMIEFSKKLDMKAVYEYAKAVMDSTNEFLKNLKFADLKKKFTAADKERLVASKCVSTDESTFWLIDYWCGKNVKGLIQMPMSRHWIMHLEAIDYIKNKLCQKAKKGVNLIAYCGLYCKQCFLTAWCGSCRTVYNTCSFATESPDGVCPNTACCKEKGIEGCYECDELYNCHKGFYALDEETNAVRVLGLFIQKYGKKEFIKVIDFMHKSMKFQKVQEVIGCDIDKGLKIMEDFRTKAILRQ